jgi:hypothetical protein
MITPRSENWEAKITIAHTATPHTDCHGNVLVELEHASEVYDFLS